ncbi:hypothetical protein B0H14DRAFT_3779665 [Mycena olivaceomarginata]|nr:hypothetical protein B0H14DRAFT_3779665 [Mycena olivaceomarginata]
MYDLYCIPFDALYNGDGEKKIPAPVWGQLSHAVGKRKTIPGWSRAYQTIPKALGDPPNHPAMCFIASRSREHSNMGRKILIVFLSVLQVEALENIYSSMFKDRTSKTSVLTWEESRRFRRSMYRILLYCELFSGSHYHLNEIDNMDEKTIKKIWRQRTAVLNAYPPDEILEIYSSGTIPATLQPDPNANVAMAMTTQILVHQRRDTAAAPTWVAVTGHGGYRGYRPDERYRRTGLARLRPGVFGTRAQGRGRVGVTLNHQVLASLDIPNIKMKYTEDASAAGRDAREASEASDVGHGAVDIILEYES